MQDLAASVERNIREQSLVISGTKVLVAFSGGPDSTALLHILNKLSKKMEFGLAACYINHKIRPRAVRKEIDFCVDFCHRLKIPMVVAEGDIPGFARESRLSLEEAGREFRYMMLGKIAREEGCQRIALGHHQDDIVETVFFRLLRGTGPQGLQPIKPLSGNIIRPLHNISRAEIEAYLRKHRIDYLLDRSNLKSEYSRNFLRNKVMPLLERRFGSGFRRNIINFADIISGEEEYLKVIAERAVKKISYGTPAGKIIVDLKQFGSYDVWLRRRIVRILLQKMTGRAGAGSFEEVERILQTAEGKLKSANVGGGMRVIREKESLLFLPKSRVIAGKEIRMGGITEVPELKARIRCRLIPTAQSRAEIQAEGRRINIDFESICPPLRIRGIKPGDRFVPLGMKGSKKVGNFMTDRKVPRYFRDEISVINDREGIIWLVGYQISDRCKIDSSTRKVLMIEFINGRDDGSA